MSLDRPAAPDRRRSSSLVALAVAAASLLWIAGCTGDDDSTATPDTTAEETGTAAGADLEITAHRDPSLPIVAQVGERFALLLDAEPSEGYRWEVVAEVDRNVVLPLGSEFVDRGDVEVPITTTTAPPPPPPPADAGGTAGTDTTAGAEPTEPIPPTEPVPLTEPPTTTTTIPTRAVQVISYVARNPGVTTVELRYVRVGEPPTEATPTVTFSIEVPVPPPLFASPEPVPPEVPPEEPPPT